jgi:membrane protein required for colicin V production
MDHTHFTNFDYVVLAVMAFSCIFAFFRGLVKEVLSLIAWIGAGFVTIHYFPQASAALQKHFRSPVVAATLAGVGIYLAALIGFGLFNVTIMKSFKSSGESGMVDNMLGLLFGAARGALMVSLGFFLLTLALPEKEYPEWLTQSVTRPYLVKGSALLAKVAPDAMRDIASLETQVEDNDNVEPDSKDNPSAAPYDKNSGNNGNHVGTRSQPTADNAPVGTNDTAGYTRSTTQQLDRLIQSTETQ